MLEFILEAAKASQEFAHQIIWNIKANMYKDEKCEEEDALKPIFDLVVTSIIHALTGPDKVTYFGAI